MSYLNILHQIVVRVSAARSAAETRQSRQVQDVGYGSICCVARGARHTANVEGFMHSQHLPGHYMAVAIHQLSRSG